MNRETAQKYLPVIQALADGKTIQFSVDGVRWLDTSKPMFSNDCVYRIKPEPQVIYAIVRSGGSIFETVKEEPSKSRMATLNRVGCGAPYTIKKFVEDMDYKPAE